MTPTLSLPAATRRLGIVDLFGDRHPRDLNRIRGFATTVALPSGRVLCERGDIGRECFAILDGHVDVDVKGRHLTLPPGVFVGEIALLTPARRRTATVMTLTGVTLLAFTPREFRHLLDSYPTIAHNIIEESTRRLTEDMET